MNTNEKNMSDNESHEDNEEIILNLIKKERNNNHGKSTKNKDSITKKEDEDFTESI